VAGVGAPAQLSASFGGTVDFRGTGAGDYVVSAVAINTSGHEGPVGTASVHVNAFGSRPPVVVTTSNSPTFPARRQTVTLSATAFDPDTACGDARTSSIAFELLSLPQGSGISFAAGASSFQADVEGTYAFRVVATEDGTGLRSDAAVLNVTVLDPDPAASSVTAVATGGSGFVVANDVDSATVTVTVRNRLGQPIGSLPVSLAVSGSSNKFNPLSGGGNTSQGGVFQATLTSTKAETKTFTATANPGTAQVVLNDHPSVTFVAGPATHFTVAVSTSPITAGVADSFTVTALDQFNNIATGYVGTADFSSTDAAAEFTPPSHTFTSGTGLDNGVFTASVKFHAAGSQTVAATDHANASIIGTSAAVTVQPGAPATAVFSVQPSSTTAGVHIAPAVEVTVTDAFTNLVPGASVTLSIGINAGGGTLSGTTTRSTTASGVASFADLSIDKAGTGYTLHGTVPSTPSAVTANSTAFDITAAAPATAAFTVQPTTTTAGVHITPAVEVTVKDAFANLVPGASVTVSIGTNPASGVLSGTLTRSTSAAGIAAFADLSINKAGTGYTL
ncbi:MAG TPA: Ig-like domain-containing protein, partial [Acidimicrobiia bacterium]